MDLTQTFEVAAGTIRGRDHVYSDKPNQDSYSVQYQKHGIVGVVCDGCGEGKHSEIGAALGAIIFGNKLENRLFDNPPVWLTPERFAKAAENLLEHTRVDLFVHLRLLWDAMNRGSTSGVIRDYFLFTCVGFVVLPDYTFTFSIGDGLIACNEDQEKLGPFPGNAPPYVAYGFRDCGADYRFVIHKIMPTSDVNSILVGTDGMLDFQQIADAKLPGTEESVGPISQFWSEEKYFKNPDAVRRKLARMNADKELIDWEARSRNKQVGLLKDDTTLVVLRRKDVPNEG